MTSPSPVTASRQRTSPAEPALSPQRGNLSRDFAEQFRELWQVASEKFRKERTSVGVSFVLHVLILAILAIPVARSLAQPETFTTIVQRDGDDQLMLGNPINADLGPAGLAAVGPDLATSQLFDQISNDAGINPQLGSALTTSSLGVANGAGDGEEGRGGGGGGGGTGKGIRIAEPQGAVRAGNFSVWSWPILGPRGPDGSATLGEPGTPPKVRQEYFIVIRIKVPRGIRRVTLADLTGMVVGTDGYRQRIPEDAYYFSTRGKLLSADPSANVPIIDGTMEVLVRVPGADIPLIQDKINVHSKMLDEEQTLELVFQPGK